MSDKLILRKNGQIVKKNVKYTKELADKILEEISEGKSIKKSCNDNGISHGTLYHWIDIGYISRDRFNAARLRNADILFDNVSDIIDRLQSCEHWGIEPRMAHVVSGSLERAARLSIDVCRRLSPEVYGDRIDMRTRSESVSYVISIDATGIDHDRGAATAGMVGDRARLTISDDAGIDADGGGDQADADAIDVDGQATGSDDTTDDGVRSVSGSVPDGDND